MHLNKTTAPRTSQALDSGARCQGEVSICWDPNCFLPMDEAKRQSWLKRITLTTSTTSDGNTTSTQTIPLSSILSTQTTQSKPIPLNPGTLTKHPTPPTCIALGVSLLAIEEVELSPKLRDVDHQEIAG